MFFAQKVATCIMECLPVFSRTWLTSRLTAESETPSDEEISLREQPGRLQLTLRQSKFFLESVKGHGRVE